MIFLRHKHNGHSRQNSNRNLNINDRLASIGGLFGAISIIITGALLYAIFTAKSEDKWYYITAVLINVALLLLLMIGAILFDRYYLKKCAIIQTLRQQTPTISNDRTAIVERTSSNSLNFPSITIDIPPQYPGYSNNVSIAANNDLQVNTAMTTKVIDYNENKLPPHYYDLYPTNNNNNNENVLNATNTHGVKMVKTIEEI
jgi:hypothetical protein